MNYCPLVLACAIFLLLAQTVGFGIYSRACFAELDIPSQFGHNTRTINSSGFPNVPFHTCSIALARSGAC